MTLWTLTLLGQLAEFFTANGVAGSGDQHSGRGTRGRCSVRRHRPPALGAVVSGAAARPPSALTAGWHTRVASIVVFLGAVSLQRTDPYVFNSGDSLLRLLCLYVAIAPGGRRALARRAPPRAAQDSGLAAAADPTPGQRHVPRGRVGEAARTGVARRLGDRLRAARLGRRALPARRPARRAGPRSCRLRLTARSRSRRRSSSSCGRAGRGSTRCSRARRCTSGSSSGYAWGSSRSRCSSPTWRSSIPRGSGALLGADGSRSHPKQMSACGHPTGRSAFSKPSRETDPHRSAIVCLRRVRRSSGRVGDHSE